MIKNLILATVIVIGIAPAQAADNSYQDDPAFGQAVRSYLLTNPEILLELAAKLEEGREVAQRASDVDLIAAQSPALFGDPRDGRLGSGEPVFVEFLDYNCGFCRRNHAAIIAFNEAHPDKAIIIKEFPILGPGSEFAARAALAVKSLHGDTAYRAINNAFLAINGQLNESSINALFAEFALDENWDAKAVMAEMQSEAITRHLADTAALATTLGIQGTPGFVFKTSINRGLMSLVQLEAAAM